ncbi:MAG: dihydroneopterin aldolase [Candidatus Eremiobacteraeota bacterium]|nr:dihydroneopterin aldolase [Candidatus Eremiobacteraeota bacterium]
MNDRIALRGMRIYGHHGANAREQVVAQPVDVDLEVEVDLRAPAESDRLGDTVDYAALQRMVVRIVAEQRYSLLERLAGEIACAALEQPRIVAVTVSVAKPRIFQESGATPSVTLHRRR